MAVLRDFLDLCGQASTSACAFSAGTPAATRDKFATLLTRLHQHPVTIGTPRGKQVPGGDETRQYRAQPLVPGPAAAAASTAHERTDAAP